MLVGSKVILRTLREKDIPLLYDLSADVRLTGDYWPFGMQSELLFKKQALENGWWDENRGGLLITDHDDRILGHIVFFKTAVYSDAYELGFRIYRPLDWGKGNMSEAVLLLVAFLFETRPTGRIQATAMVGNTASQRLLEHCGFQFEGIMRRGVFFRGEHRDLQLFSIVRGEHRPLSELLAP